MEVNPQQFREGLAEQMARMHVKMPYASMQLKHLAVSSQRALRGLPADITMRYGNYPRTLLSTVVGVDAVARIKTEQARSLFGAQRAFAGGERNYIAKKWRRTLPAWDLKERSERTLSQRLPRMCQCMPQASDSVL